MQSTLLIIVLVLISQSVMVPSQAPSQYTLEDMCTRSRNKYLERMTASPRAFTSWSADILTLTDTVPAEKINKYFHPKPVNTPNASICQPMNTTCCKPRMEKIITKVAEKEYGELFLNVTHESIRSCLEVGRLFYHAIHSNFIEMRRQLEISINSFMDEKLGKNFFDNFFSYLSGFPFTSDICSLNQELEAVMVKLFDFVIQLKGGRSLRKSHGECYYNVSTEIMENVYEELFIKLERQVYNLDLIQRAMQLSGKIIESLSHHQFSHECTKPLTQLQNCGHCSGYSKFKPCLFYCINLLRGCFADIADVHQEFRLLTKALSDIPDDILPTFRPTTFIQDSLGHLIDLVKDLWERDLNDEVAEACSGRATVVTRQKKSPLLQRRSTISAATPTISAATPTSTQDDDILLEAFNVELQCMENIASLLGSIPEKMCYLSKDYKTIAHTGNHRCWTGAGMGTYSKPAVPAHKEAQAKNPAFKEGVQPYLDQYRELASDISVVAAEVNGTLDSILCLDDEECFSSPIYDCEVYEPEPITFISSSGGGSGSGSGSGKAIDDGMRDMEDGDSSGDANDEEDVDDPFPTPILPDTLNSNNTTSDNTTSNNTTSVESGDDGYSVIEIPNSGDNISTNTTNDPSPPPVTPHVYINPLADGTPALHSSNLQLGLSLCVSLVLLKLH